MVLRDLLRFHKQHLSQVLETHWQGNLEEILLRRPRIRRYTLEQLASEA